MMGLLLFKSSIPNGKILLGIWDSCSCNDAVKGERAGLFLPKWFPLPAYFGYFFQTGAFIGPLFEAVLSQVASDD